MRLLPRILLILLLMGCSSSSKPELHLFMWADYIKPELIWRFEREHNCRVVIDTYDSNEAMYAKLKLGVSGYDLIFPSSYIFTIMIAQNMLEELALSHITNAHFIDKTYQDRLPSIAKSFGIPYMISFTGIGYRQDKLKNFDPTWWVFGKKELKGRMTMLNDMRETLGSCLITLGYSCNTKNRAEIEAAADLLIKWKPNLAKFENEQYKNGIATAEFIAVQGYNGDISQVIEENPFVAFAYPKEGVTFSIDLVAMPKKAPNQELAYQFINYLLQPDVAAENIAFTQFLSPNTGAYKLVSEEMRNNPAIFTPKEVLAKAELLDDVGEAIDYYTEAWDRAKSE